ncbi:MAG: hypothetical protein C6Y20_10365 [Tagaea sp. CACIAM 22H2]|nr:hypothetical protein [Tagaea sp. CACIAM 22H2]
MRIAFVDFEASALHGGYPIEVGYARSDGKVGAILIKPRLEWRDLTWSAASERIHGLSRSVLDQGQSAETALGALNVALDKYACFSDAPAFDWHWLRMLDPEQPLRFRPMMTPADSLLMMAAEEAGVPGPVAARIVDRAIRLGGHTAAGDAAALAAGYEVLCYGGEIRMRDVEASFRNWQALAFTAAYWRKG